MALALALRIAVVLADGGYAPAHDAFDYDLHARSIAAGVGYPESGYVLDRGPSALRPPLYPYALGVLYALSGDSIAAGRLANAALGALAVLLVYLIADAIWARRVAIAAAGLAAVFPPLVLLGRDLLSESLFLVLELGAVLCLLRLRRSASLGWAAAAGALCGLAALTRNPGVALLAPMALGAWMLRPRLSARALAAPALLLLCAALVIAPWTLRNAAEFDRFVPISSSLGFAMAGTYNRVSLEDERHPGSFRTPMVVPAYQNLFTTPGIDEARLDATLRREALGFAWDHPAYVLRVTGNNLLRLFELKGGSVVGAHNVGGGRLVADPEAISEERGIGSATPPAERIGLALAAPFALLGALAIWRSRRGLERSREGLPRYPLGPWFLWLVPVVMVLVAAPVNGLPRYRVPADPFMLILVAIGLVWAWDRLAAVRARRPRGPTAAAAALAAVAAIGLGGCGGDDDGGEAGTGTATSTAASDPEKQRYIARADRVCRRSFRRGRAIGRRFSPKAPAVGDPLVAFTELLVAPGIPLLEDLVRRLRALEPRPDDPDLDRYLSLFDPGLELLYQRLRAGRRGDLGEARKLETLLVELRDEQREAARRFGLRVCDKNFLQVLLSGL